MRFLRGDERGLLTHSLPVPRSGYRDLAQTIDIVVPDGVLSACILSKAGTNSHYVGVGARKVKYRRGRLFLRP